MTCTQCTHDRHNKTLYDKTLSRRVETTSRRSKRAGAVLLSLGLLSGGTVAGLSPAHAASYGGFNTVATATPLKLEIFEPAIPIPTVPQFELDFSYTRVQGDSGPTTTARASAMWPGPAIGEGLKTFGEQLGFPAALTAGGYPVQSNAQFPGDPSEAASEPLPGQIQRVKAADKVTVAKAGYTASGDLKDGTAGTPSGTPTNPLTDLLGGLSKGDPSALTGLLTGGTTGSSTNPVQTNPLGALSVLIDPEGMSSISTTTYDGDTVTATATSRIGQLRLLAGVITMSGVNVVTKVVSSNDGGAKTSQTVDVGGMTIAGQKFSYGPDGFTAMGKTTSIPGLPSNAADLLKMLGVEIKVPAPVITKNGLAGSVDAEAASISIDTKPLRSKLPSLPLDALINGLPDLPGQASILKGLLLSLNTLAPKIVLHLGVSSASATTVTPINFGGGGVTNPPTTTPPGGSVPGGTGVVPPTNTGVVPGATPPTDGTLQPTVSPTINPQALIQGLPPLGSVPMLLILGGLLLAAGIGWYLRRAGLLLFGGAAACPHGFKAGIPDLRKV